MPSDLGKNNLVSVMQKQVHLEKPGTVIFVDNLLYKTNWFCFYVKKNKLVVVFDNTEDLF